MEIPRISETVPCTLCGETAATLIMTGGDRRFAVGDEEFGVVRCRGCGLVRLSPRPRLDRLGEYYPRQFYDYRFAPARGRLRRWVRQRRARALVSEKMRIVHRLQRPPGRLLDVGSAAGEFLVHARERGWDVTGVEFDADTAEAVRSGTGIEILTGSVLEVDLPIDVDVCTLWASLEHLEDPVEGLRRIRRALKPGGLVVVLVPNYASWEARTLGAGWGHLDIPRHLHHFEASTLDAVFRGAGFETMAVTTPLTRLAVSHWGTWMTGGRRLGARSRRVLDWLTFPLRGPVCALAAAVGRNHTLLGVARRPASPDPSRLRSPFHATAFQESGHAQ